MCGYFWCNHYNPPGVVNCEVCKRKLVRPSTPKPQSTNRTQAPSMGKVWENTARFDPHAHMQKDQEEEE